MDRITQMLELMDRPSFCARDGIIIALNSAAARRQLKPGMALEPLLTSGVEDYHRFREGYLYLGMDICGEGCTAMVTYLHGYHVFSLDPAEPSAELRALALAAQELREPLSGVMALWDEHLGGLSGADAAEAASITRGLYQLLRTVSNMTPHPAPRMEMVEMNALIREVWDGAVPACESRGVVLRFTGHTSPIYTLADGGLLTRAIHNLLSNALKFTAPGGTIDIRLSMEKRQLYLTVRDSGSADAPAIHDPFTRYRREPGLEDPRTGLGLGLLLVRNAAISHGGAVHLLPGRDGGVLVSMSLPIRQEKTNLRSPALRLDYTGGRSPLLIELSDVLPPEFYQK